MSFEAIVDDGRQRTTPLDNGHPTITLAHHEPMAQVSLNSSGELNGSGELKSTVKSELKLTISTVKSELTYA